MLVQTAQQRLVSIHAPVKGATNNLRSYQGLHQVSIHAPVKGATPVQGDFGLDGSVSIHAPVKGATSRSPSRSRAASFQSTRP